MRTAAVALIAIGFLLAPGCKRDHETGAGWAKTFGGTKDDWGNSVRQTSDGGYIIAGATDSYGAGNDDLWLVKTDSSGDTIWTRTYGGTNSDVGSAVEQTRDGGYVIVGTTMSYDLLSCDIWLSKSDVLGNRVWMRTFDLRDWAEGYAVQQTQDEGYIIAGDAVGEDHYDDVWLIKTDANGASVWTKTFGGSSEDVGRAVQQTNDGGYVVAGSTMSFGAGGRDVWLIRTDASGDTLWTRTYGGTRDDWAQSVQQTQDGGCIIAGSTFSHRSDGCDFWLVRTDSAGVMVWDKTYGGSGLNYGCSVQQTLDGGYIVTGRTEFRGAGSVDVWLIKTDDGGNTVWTRALGGPHGDMGWSVQQTRDGGYVIAGSTESYGAGGADVWLVKTDAEGRVDEDGGK